MYTKVELLDEYKHYNDKRSLTIRKILATIF